MTTCHGCNQPMEPLAQVRTYHTSCDPQGRVEMLERALRQHADFWDFLVGHFFEDGCLELDGAEFQARATRCGLLRTAEPGCDWYISTGIARAALAYTPAQMKGREG